MANLRFPGGILGIVSDRISVDVQSGSKEENTEVLASHFRIIISYFESYKSL